MRHNYRRTVRSLWTWLWGRYHVPQNAFLVFITICIISRYFASENTHKIEHLIDIVGRQSRTAKTSSLTVTQFIAILRLLAWCIPDSVVWDRIGAITHFPVRQIPVFHCPVPTILFVIFQFCKFHSPKRFIDVDTKQRQDPVNNYYIDYTAARRSAVVSIEFAADLSDVGTQDPDIALCTWRFRRVR